MLGEEVLDILRGEHIFVQKKVNELFDKRREQASFHYPISRIGCLAQMTCQL